MISQSRPRSHKQPHSYAFMESDSARPALPPCLLFLCLCLARCHLQYALWLFLTFPNICKSSIPHFSLPGTVRAQGMISPKCPPPGPLPTSLSLALFFRHRWTRHLLLFLSSHLTVGTHFLIPFSSSSPSCIYSSFFCTIPSSYLKTEFESLIKGKKSSLDPMLFLCFPFNELEIGVVVSLFLSSL